MVEAPKYCKRTLLELYGDGTGTSEGHKVMNVKNDQECNMKLKGNFEIHKRGEGSFNKLGAKEALVNLFKGLMKEKEEELVEREKLFDVRRKERDLERKKSLDLLMNAICHLDKELKKKDMQHEMRARALESKEKKLEEQRDRLDSRQKLMYAEAEKHELQRKKSLKLLRERMFREVQELEMKEKQYKQRGVVLDLKEKQLEEGAMFLELMKKKCEGQDIELESKQKQLEGQEKDLKLKEKEFVSQMKELESKKKHFEGHEKEFKSKEEVLEGRLKQLELKEKQTNERVVDLNSREKQINEQVVDLNSREKQFKCQVKEFKSKENEFDEQVNELQRKERQIESQWKELDSKEMQLEGRVKELETKENEFDEQLKELQQKERQFESQGKELESKMKKFEDRVKELETKEKHFEEQVKELKLKETQFEGRVKDLGSKHEALIQLFKDEKVPDEELSPTTNGRSLKLLSNVKTNEVEFLASNDVLVYLKTSSDPAQLVLDIIQNPISPWREKGCNGLTIESWQIVLLEQLMRLSPQIKSRLRDEAMKLAHDLEADIRESNENSVLVLSFLLLLSIYGLASDFNEDKVLKLFEFAAQHKQALELFRSLGFTDKVSDFVQNLIKKQKHIEAVGFICAYNLVEKNGPVDLLREYTRNSRLVCEKICKESKSLELKVKAIDQEIASLDAVLQCISDNNIESQDLQKEIQDRIIKLHAEANSSVYTVTMACLQKCSNLQ
ncbi:hypothetical protein Lal_00045871 [Lupinus albus]|uniref:FRIGIDA-like protein n=1 Tax=Lupinus albus TaxID=3870 RepID=A0A6A5NPD6_LUPAL|nr:hypothetical protein Lalb_Chr14g0367481 [Lupinus albus]KAF1886638.1 hypothetical protein Lal_00045871 [Lupinus albus]